MALTLDVSHEFPFSAQRYLEIFLDPAFATYVKEHSKLDVYDVERQETVGGVLKRTVLVVPRAELPGWMSKLLGGRQLAYREHMTHAEGSDRLQMEMVPTVLADKLSIKGEVKLEALGAERCRRSARITVKASILGLGSKLEEKIGENARSGYDKGHTNMIAFHRLSHPA